MNIGIIGAGITGLSAAYQLSKADANVTVLECSDSIGGMGKVVYFDGVPVEKYYHHYFRSDKYLIELVKELGLGSRLMWLPSHMGYFVDNNLYDFGTPISLLKFSPLSFTDKMRFGMSLIEIMGSKDYKKLENITAHEWIQKHAGPGVYNKVWKPLLITKFGEKYRDISMAWFWGKINLRGSSRKGGREVLGYLDGSNEMLLDRLSQKLSERGVQIILNCSVSSIKKDREFTLNTSCGNFKFDRIISTIPLPRFIDIAQNILPPKYVEEKRKIEYTSVVCTILSLDRPFTKYYWLNIGDKEIPFGGLIEHTNLLGCEMYNNNHILYISNYLYKDSPYYNMNIGELLEKYTVYLKRINPKFDQSWVNRGFVFKDEYAQPIIKKGYSSFKPMFETPVKGLYTASMCNIYPEDRGMNYAIRDGYEAALLLLKEG